MFEYKLNHVEYKMLNGKRFENHHYDILDGEHAIGYIVAEHNKSTDIVTLTVRVKWLETYTASGTARRMLQEIIEGIIYHKSKAKINFNQHDLHTVALLELSNISSKIAFN